MAESKQYIINGSQKKRFVTIPANLADQAGMKAKDPVTWELRDNTLILRKARS